MVLDYYPMDIDKTYEFIWDECGYNDNISVEEIISDLLDNRFCKYIYKIGKNNGQMCMRKFSKNKDYNSLSLCRRHRYQEKHKCLEENCNKLIKYNKYCKKHNIPLYKKCFHYNDYDENHISLYIDFNCLFNKSWKKTIYTTRSNGVIYGFGSNTLDFEKDISFYILKINKETEKKKQKNKNKLKFVFIYICNNIKKKNKIKNDNQFKKLDTKASDFFKIDKNKLLSYLNNLYLLINNNKSFDEIKSFMLNIINIIEMYESKKKINNYISNIINKQLNPSIIYNILDEHKKKRIKSNLNNIIIKDIYEINGYFPKLICYISKNPEERKNKKKLQKFNIKYNKLLQLNNKTIDLYKSNVYFKYINNIIDSNMKILEKKINKKGKDIQFIRNTYNCIYNELVQLEWEVDNKLNKKDYEIINNIESWRDYAIHEDEEYKKLLKI